MKNRKNKQQRQEQPNQRQQQQQQQPENMEFGEEFNFEQKRKQPGAIETNERRNNRK